MPLDRILNHSQNFRMTFFSTHEIFFSSKALLVFRICHCRKNAWLTSEHLDSNPATKHVKPNHIPLFQFSSYKIKYLKQISKVFQICIIEIHNSVHIKFLLIGFISWFFYLFNLIWI